MDGGGWAEGGRLPSAPTDPKLTKGQRQASRACIHDEEMTDMPTKPKPKPKSRAAKPKKAARPVARKAAPKAVKRPYKPIKLKLLRPVPSDIDIAQAVRPKPVTLIAQEE